MSQIWNGSYTLGDSQETQITAGTGIKVTTPEAGQIQISNDETVLYNGKVPAMGNTITLSEPWTNFEMIRVNGGGNTKEDHYYSAISPTKPCFHFTYGYNWIYEVYIRFTPTNDAKVWTYESNTLYYLKNSDTTLTVVQNDTSNITTSTDFKIVGINRK